ncbi:SDR family NAD(P)-dependent oxidoreductase [Roseibacterium sp. SDUM158017]|uniref:SDR family NAD(P)-dependent oxidoreductase n=1 Tax=Roseicyclus salinarum TaxID=3036773 RepID=UPI00241567E0|nr:SDR family NAD(P)-dependent oxidoreductase [Roseibacterium sp. SDUM158017]MDG4648595.1 SDR family NAD(P)-dependent oxidoreductase [Roseibacterium sp. SDUM158017]
MDLRFDGKTAIVTGAASGIGLAIAGELAASGATVIAADLDGKKTADAAERIGHGALATTADVAKPDEVEAMIAFATERTGRLDMLVNNAGIGGPMERTGDYPIDGWHAVMNVNLHGVFYGMRHAIPQMTKTGGGAIVNISSILGAVGFANAVAYVAAKHALLGLTKTAALEHASDGIRVNAVGPGFIHTPLIDANLDAETQDALAGLHALGRMGDPAEVASLVVYLLSDRASFITGSYHLVDGGYTAQ